MAEHDGDSVSGTHRRSDPTLRGSRTIKSPVLSPQLYAGSPSQSSINLLQPEQDEGAGSWQRPLSRRRNVVALNADGKTFTLIPHQDRVGTSGVVGGGGADGRRGSAGGGDGFKSPPLSSTTNSSHERLSFEALSEDRPSSPLTTVRDHSHSVSPSSTSSARLADDHMSTSPWNYRMVGGLRKVPKTPDLKQKRALYSRSSENFLDPLPESPHVAASSSQNDRRSHPDHLHHHHHYLATRTSFSSSPSAVSENTNYKVYGGSSSPPQGDVDSRPASSTNSNYEIHGEPTPSPTTPTFANLAVPSSSPGAENYIVHGDPSPSPSSSSSLVTVSRQLRTRQSNESLVVPPLIPPLSRGKISTIEKFGYYRSRSRESLRAASLTSISSILGEQAVQSLFASPANPLLQSIPSSTRPPKQEQHQHQQDPATWASSSPPGSSPTRPPSSPMNAHPWSSQLSTVMSESEEGGGSDLGSRSLSVSSAGGRHHSRRTLSISSSIAAQDEHSRAFSFTHSIAESLERPQPAYTRGGAGNHYMQHHQHMYQRAEASASSSTPRLIRDQDEHGDGLADLRDAGSPALQHKHSRTKLGGFLSAASLSDRNLHSSAGSSVVSRANSFNAASLPAWARLYYSVGVPLTAPSELTLSEAPDSRPQTSNPEQHHGYGGRHRNYYIPGSRGGAGPSVAGPPNHPLIGFDPSRRLGKKSSSIWSPHLRTDKRASRFSMWEAPPGTWSIDSQPVGPRSAQVGLFIVGFVFPFGRFQ